MALKDFRGKTFVAFTDISGFKGMMKKEEAGRALQDFFAIGYDVLNENPNVSGVFISDCGILYHSKENVSELQRLQEILKVIQEINKKMANLNYILTTSIAYGDFEYQDKIELTNMTKNALQGNAYLDAFIDNEYTTPKLKAGECRIIENDEIVEELDALSNNRFALKKKNKHYYFYWMIKENQTIEEYEARIKAVESNYSEKSKQLNDDKYEALKDVIKNPRTVNE